MNQALFPVDIERLSEVDAPPEALDAIVDPATPRSRAVYALPAASFLTAGCDLDLLGNPTSANIVQPPFVDVVEDPSLADPLSSPSVDVIVNPAPNTPSVTDVASSPPPVEPLTPPAVEVATPTATPSMTDITSNLPPVDPVTPPAVEVGTPNPPPSVTDVTSNSTPPGSSAGAVVSSAPGVSVPIPAVDVTATSAVVAPLLPALNPANLLPIHPPPPPLPAASGRPATTAEAAQFILKASLSVNEQDIADLQSTSYGQWLVKQLDMPIEQTGFRWMEDRGFNSVNAQENFYRRGLGDFMVWDQLMNSPDAVRKKIAFALSQFFVVSVAGMDIHWNSNAITYYWDLLNKNAFGNFRTLLEDITLCPIMGVYLSMLGNKKEDERTGRVPDENFAREIMQLFTIGLYKLNNDGTLYLEGGQPVETYTNDDVTNLARVFTGYHYDFSGNGKTPMVRSPSVLFNNSGYVYKPMTNDPRKWERPQTTSEHSLKEKKFLKTVIEANTDAPTSLKRTLDDLFNHDNVGPFFCKQMIQRLITSNPSPAYVGRVVSVFNNNGSGVRGDLRAVFKAILLDIEAISPANRGTPTAGKLREPVHRLVQWGRTFGAKSKTGNWMITPLMDPATTLSQSPLRSPSVFNFFRPGYVPPNTAISENKLVAPEFQLVSEVSVAGYVNFMASAIRGEMNSTSWDVSATYMKELAIAHNSTALLDRLCLLLAANQISDRTKATILEALNAETILATSPQSSKQRRVFLAVLLVMASTDYLVQK